MKNVKVTVITPCYNSEKTIKDTIESVLNQTYKNIEYIIVDGGSNDKTLEIINGYKSLFEGRMKVISEKDDGIYDAMNKGIVSATGDVIGIVNSDDFYELNAVEIMVGALTDEKYQILYGFQRCLENRKEIRVVIFNHNNLKNQMITHPTCFVTRNVYLSYGLFDCTYRSSADYEFMLRMSAKSNVEFIPVYEIISNFELGGMSSTATGELETAKLKLNYKVINKFQYIYWVAKIYIHNFLKNFGRLGG